MESTVFGRNLAKKRKACGMTQEQLAQKMNVSPQAVSKWEKNSYPDGELLPLLAKRLNTSLDVLFGLKEKETEVDIEQIITDEIHNTPPEKRSELMMRMFYSAIGAYNEYSVSKMSMPKNLELETYAEMRINDAIALSRLNENLQYFCFMSIPPEGIDSYAKISVNMVRLFKLLGDENALKIIYYLGGGYRNRMHSKEIISERLNIPIEKVSKVIDELDRFGLVWRMTAEISDNPPIIYGYTYNTALTFIIALAKTITNYIQFREIYIDTWNKGAFSAHDKKYAEPVPQVSRWESEEDNQK